MSKLFYPESTSSALAVCNPRLEHIAVWPSRGLEALQYELGIEAINTHLDDLMSSYLTRGTPKTSNLYLAAVEASFMEHSAYGQLLLERLWYSRESGTCHYLMTENFCQFPGVESVVGRRYHPAPDPDDSYYQYRHEANGKVEIICNWSASGRHWHDN